LPSPARLKYVWFQFTSSVVGRGPIRITIELFEVSRYVTSTSSVPGYPSSPSGLVYVSFRPTVEPRWISVASQIRLSNP
jgi:hypothetical protein